MRVDHVENYRLPKKVLEQEEAKQSEVVHGDAKKSGRYTRTVGAGHAYMDSELDNPQFNLQQGQDLFDPTQHLRQQEKNETKRRKKHSKRDSNRHRRKRYSSDDDDHEQSSPKTKEHRKKREKKSRRD